VGCNPLTPYEGPKLTCRRGRGCYEPRELLYALPVGLQGRHPRLGSRKLPPEQGPRRELSAGASRPFSRVVIAAGPG